MPTHGLAGPRTHEPPCRFSRQQRKHQPHSLRCLVPSILTSAICTLNLDLRPTRPRLSRDLLQAIREQRSGRPVRLVDCRGYRPTGVADVLHRPVLSPYCVPGTTVD